MSRPQLGSRRICHEPKFAEFSPDCIDNTEVIRLSLDEFEVIRLVDLEKRHTNNVLYKWKFPEPPLQKYMKVLEEKSQTAL